MDERPPQDLPPADAPPRMWQALRTALIVILTVGATGALLTLDVGPSAAGVSLAVGDVAPRDILAPRPVTYVSQVLTEEARDLAALAVPPVYNPPDGRVARRQVAKLRVTLSIINSVRSDTLTKREERLAQLQVLDNIQLSPETAEAILGLSQFAWERVQREAVSVLEAVMRTQVREDRLEDARQAVPALVSVDLAPGEAELAALLAQAFVAPNSLYSESATEQARLAARESVGPVSQSFITNQTVIRRGQIVSAADIEALEALGLLRETSLLKRLLSTSLATLLALTVLLIFVRRYQPSFDARPKRVLLFCLLCLLFLLGAKWMVPGHTVLPYLFPAASLAMMVAVVYGPHLAITVAVVLAGLIGFIGGNNFELAIYAAVGGIVATLALGAADRMNAFFWAGLASAAADIAVILASRVPDGATDPMGIATLVGASLINGAVSASLTLALFFVVGTLFDVTTSLQLIELSRPNQPLLQLLLRAAPGSYQHSLQVANLAEQAAEVIGANPLLVRVGALYHDVGKALRPDLYVENQLEGSNIHEKLDPATSSELIIGHVQDGLDMARRHRLPSRVRAFVPEHHGTLRTNYQYKRALDAAGGDASKVDQARFRYPGPRPQSKETALLMLADGCEAKVRSDRPTTVEELDRIVKVLIDDRVAQGQLDDTGLTLNDLKRIRQSFVASLKGMFHSRIRYPDLAAPEEPGTQELPQAAA